MRHMLFRVSFVSFSFQNCDLISPNSYSGHNPKKALPFTPSKSQSSNYPSKLTQTNTAISSVCHPQNIAAKRAKIQTYNNTTPDTPALYRLVGWFAPWNPTNLLLDITAKWVVSFSWITFKYEPLLISNPNKNIHKSIICKNLAIWLHAFF